MRNGKRLSLALGLAAFIFCAVLEIFTLRDFIKTLASGLDWSLLFFSVMLFLFMGITGFWLWKDLKEKSFN